MGNLETRNWEGLKKDRLQKVILGTVAAAGMLSVALVAPNVIQALYKLGILPNPRRKEYISSSASKLVRRGLLKFNGKYYELTPSGRKILRRWEMFEYSFKKPRNWDGKWRMIIFDIPEKKKGIRLQVSSLFRRAGFYRLQDSVWVYPYNCEDIIGLMKTDFGVGKEILYVIADEIENDRHLRQEFKLSS